MDLPRSGDASNFNLNNHHYRVWRVSMIAMNSSWHETAAKTAAGVALAIPALVYFTWQREGVLMAAFCSVAAANAFFLASMRMSWTTYLNLAVIAPLILFGSFVGRWLFCCGGVLCSCARAFNFW